FKRLLSVVEVTAADMEVTTAGSSYNCWLWFLLLAKELILSLDQQVVSEPAQTTTNVDGTLTTLIPSPVTTEEKDAKTLFAAIQTRFGGNEATKKTQKTLLKQMYENFSALITESLDSIFNRLQKIVKGTTSSSSSSQNMAFVSSPNNTNEINIANGVSIANTQISPASTQVSTVSTQVSTVSTQVSTDNLSDAIVYAFLASQPNGSQLVHEDLIQIHKDDLEKMDLKCQLALLSMRTRKFFLENWECKQSRNQDSRNKNQDSSRRTVNVKEIASKEMVAINGAGLFSPSKLDLSNSGLEEFQQPEFEGYGPKTSNSVSEDISNEVKESHDAPLVKELVLDDKLEKKTVFPSVAKIEFVRPKQQEKPVRKPVKYAEMYRSQCPRGNQRNWNNQKSKQLGSDFVLYNKACFIYGSFDHVQANCNYHQRERVEKGVIDSGSSRHMTGISYLSEYEEIDGGYVAFGGDPRGGKITGKGNVDTEETLHIKVLENKPNVEGSGLTWLFDIDTLTKSMNYKPVVTGNQSNGSLGKAIVQTVPDKDYILLPLWTQDLLFSSSFKDSPSDGFIPSGEEEKKDAKYPGNEDNEDLTTEEPRVSQEKDSNVNITNNISNASLTTNATGIKHNVVDKDIVYGCTDDPNMPNLEEIFYLDEDKDVGAEADMTNLDTNIFVSPISTTRIYKDHPVKQIFRDIHSAPQTRRIKKNLTNYEPKKVIQALTDPSWIEAMHDELLLNKKDERGIVVRNKARLVAQGYTQEEGIDYDEVFALVARIEAVILFLAYASFKDFVVYQMDVKSAFLYAMIEEEVYVCQPPGFEDPEFPDIVYKVEKALYGLHQAPRAWYETLSTYLLDNGFHKGQIDKTLFIKRVKGDILLIQVYVDDIIFRSTRMEMCTEFEKIMHKNFQMSSMGELTLFLGLQVTQKDDGIFISQDKYMDQILKKLGFSTMKTASTPMETLKPLLKDENAVDIDVHL
nr:retrovirus-related Pol polyprotein from transposon TNT 1-94 [Tanacetum cinerariifolium]